MRLIDTHCHLTNARLAGQTQRVLDAAREAGVVGVICASSDIDESRKALALADSNTDVWFIAGVHPHEAKDVQERYLTQLQELLGHPRCVGAGEIGLDYHYDFSPRDAQRGVFAGQLALASELGKPIVIHTREAFDDTLAILRESGVDGGRVVFHSFTEGPDNARRALDFGATISFSGIVTFANAQDVRASALLVPQDRLLVETDAPYLSPEPVRKMKTNEPANVAHVCRFLAQLRGVPADDLAQATTANAKKFFGC